jgi:protein-S-isoprenylcysteine O-methyltransferase Ste14
MLLNIPSLPFPVILKVIGVVMFVIGVVLASIAQILLLGIGEGFPLLSLTKKLTDNLLYERTRNPMLLGLYLTVVGMGLSAGSTFFTFWSLMALIPSNIFWLKYFEERELEMRFGQSYREYKQRVPFLIPSFRKMTGTKSVNNND